MAEEGQERFEEGLKEKEVERLRQATRLPPEARFNHDVLQEHFCRNAGDLAYWGEKYAKAQLERDRAKREAKVAEARVYVNLRENFPSGKNDQGVPLTEAYLAAKVQISQTVLEAQEALAKAEYTVQSLRSIVDSIHAKRESMISLGAGLRKEMRGEPSLRKEEEIPRF